MKIKNKKSFLLLSEHTIYFIIFMYLFFLLFFLSLGGFYSEVGEVESFEFQSPEKISLLNGFFNLEIQEEDYKGKKIKDILKYIPDDKVKNVFDNYVKLFLEENLGEYDASLFALYKYEDFEKNPIHFHNSLQNFCFLFLTDEYKKFLFCFEEIKEYEHFNMWVEQ